MMSLIPGRYQHYKNEDIEEFFTAVGVPYLGRKAITLASPTIEISLHGDTMTLKEKSLIFTLDNTFKLGEEYDENMPAKVLKSVTSIINDCEMVTNLVESDTGAKGSRHYLFSENECIVTFTHEKASKPTKRYFLRIKT